MWCVLGSGNGVPHRCNPPVNHPATAYRGGEPREHMHGEEQTSQSDERPKDPHSPQLFPSTARELEDLRHASAAGTRYEQMKNGALNHP